MNFDLAALLPAATVWAEAQAAIALTIGKPLDAVGVDAAWNVGVLQPELVRAVDVDSIPSPPSGLPPLD